MPGLSQPYYITRNDLELCFYYQVLALQTSTAMPGLAVLGPSLRASCTSAKHSMSSISCEPSTILS